MSTATQKTSLYEIPPGCICQGDGLFGMKCDALEHVYLKRVPVVKVTRPDTSPGATCIYALNGFSAVDEFDGAENGESVVLTLGFMSEKELRELPDFSGW